MPEERIDDKEGEGMEKCNERGGKKISRIDRLTASSTRSMVDDCFNIRIPYFNEKLLLKFRSKFESNCIQLYLK